MDREKQSIANVTGMQNETKQAVGVEGTSEGAVG